ncbi:MAG: GIY-YIG nuclease family protein [Candidatus Dependentiae bacterium]|nr:GIY-YIG nuclease family protein [Candidatus Dependentiae bacterium]
MYHVYILRSINYPELTYVGYTLNIQERLKTHNAGGSIHTATHKPWELVMFLTFHDEKRAREFEHYLKTQSGRAFLSKRFL